MSDRPSSGMSVAAVNGAYLAYDLTGDGPAIVLVHAGIADRRMWDDQFAAFSPQYRVLRYDCRGFGASDMPAGPFSHYADLIRLLDSLGLDRVALVGNSMGGGVALDTTLAFPDRITALVLLNTLAGTDTRTDTRRRAWDDTDAALEAGDVERALEIELRTWVDGPSRTPDQVDPAVRARVAEMNRLLLQRSLIESERGDEESRSPPAHERLAEVRVPTLLITGSLDLPDVQTSMTSLAAGIPHAEQVVIAGAAHMASMEQPHAFNAAVLDFLARQELQITQ